VRVVPGGTITTDGRCMNEKYAWYAARCVMKMVCERVRCATKEVLHARTRRKKKAPQLAEVLPS